MTEHDIELAGQAGAWVNYYLNNPNFELISINFSPSELTKFAELIRAEKATTVEIGRR